VRTNIEVDDALIKQAQELSGLKTKRAVVDAALRMFVRVQHQKDVLKIGKVEFWDDVVLDRDENRLDR
jgi:Arc/MetJ family transcription regulator